MPSHPIPSIDNNPVTKEWSPEDRDAWNAQDYYFVKGDIKERNTWPVWKKLLGTFSWETNKGPIARTVMSENTPVMRQLAKINPLTSTPKVDVIATRERTTDATVGWHRFVSPHFNFYPSFNAFMGDYVKPARRNITKQMVVFEEMLYRAHMFGYAPYVFLAGYGLIQCQGSEMFFDNTADGATLNDNGVKNKGWFQEKLALVTEPLSYKTMKECAEDAIDLVGCTPFSGSDQGPDIALNEKWCIVTNTPTIKSLVDDPWVTENRPLALDIVNKGFHPTPFGDIMLKRECYGFRIKATDDSYTPLFPMPEVYDSDATSIEYNRTRPNPVYAKDSQYSVSWFVGGDAYDTISVGAPPADFASGSIPANFRNMKWNGEIYSTKDFLIWDSDGNPDTNSWGHYLRLQSEATFGIRGRNRFNVIPIIHLTRRAQLKTAMAPVMGNRPVSQVVVS